MLVIASPIYYYSLSGQTHCAIERIYAFERLPKLKKAALLLTAAGGGFTSAIQTYRDAIIGHMGAKDLGIVTALILILVSALGLSACGNTDRSDIPVTEIDTQESRPEQEETPLPTDNDNNHTEVTGEMTTIQVIINGQEFEAELNDNEAARQFTEMLPIQLDMEDLHDNEKYFYFSDDFDTADEELKEIHEGDLLIYDSKCLVLFYESFETTYQYTPLGKISDTAGLKEALGTGTAAISFQTAENTTDTAQTSANDISFNFETKTVTLNSGYEMPIYGIGTYSLLNEECVNSVTTALENGVRLIDTAHMYHNEESVGEAVRNSDIPREEIFVITPTSLQTPKLPLMKH